MASQSPALSEAMDTFARSEWFSAPTDLSGHWKHFRRTPAAGIDADAKHLPFVKAVVEEMLERLRHARAAMGGAETRRYQRTFYKLWPSGPLGLDMAGRKGLRYTPSTVLAVHHANTILSHVRPTTILEIGAGLGHLSALLRRVCGARIYIVDLPETIMRAAPRLAHHGTVALPHQEPVSDINFLVPSQLDRVPPVQLAINIASMQEMRLTEIARYFDWLRGNAELFYCVNRVEKWLSDEAGSADTTGARQDYPVRFTDYPWGDCDDILYRISRFHRLVAAEPVFERLTRLCPGDRPNHTSQS
ncbi:MAG TPA: putative sugar O-methyltransferase [Alphaproteobacteria bacterium]